MEAITPFKYRELPSSINNENDCNAYRSELLRLLKWFSETSPKMKFSEVRKWSKEVYLLKSMIKVYEAGK